MKVVLKWENLVRGSVRLLCFVHSNLPLPGKEHPSAWEMSGRSVSRKQEHFFVVLWSGKMTFPLGAQSCLITSSHCPVKCKSVWETLKPTKQTWRPSESMSCSLIQGDRRVTAQQIWECVAWERADGWCAWGKLGRTFCLCSLRDPWSHNYLAASVLTLIVKDVEGIDRGQKWTQKMCFGPFSPFCFLSLLLVIAVVMQLKICELIFPCVPFSLCALT